ncbi:MAG: TIGR01777 family protein [Syntrophaceae bacterium]|nr:TIGR01777 family protein [Syntrophaceae bacterium]
MMIFMTGGTGFVGTKLTKAFTARGHEVTILTRPGEGRPALPAGARYLEGDPTRPGPWQDRAVTHEVFINLAGASIFSRWTERRKRDLRESRILTTRNLVEALRGRSGRETHLLSTSAVGYYGFHDEGDLHESDGLGEDFLARLAVDWEAEAMRAREAGVRVMTCRFGIVLGRGGGALAPLERLFRLHAGSPVGSGRQWFSWIHEGDLARIFLYLMERTDLDGPFNCTAPGPVRNTEFTRALADALRVPAFLPPVPGFLMRLVLGEFGGVILKGQKVMPGRLLKEGFHFQFPDLPSALEDLLPSRP